MSTWWPSSASKAHRQVGLLRKNVAGCTGDAVGDWSAEENTDGVFTAFTSLTIHAWGVAFSVQMASASPSRKWGRTRKAVRVIFWPLFVLDRRGPVRASRPC